MGCLTVGHAQENLGSSGVFALASTTSIVVLILVSSAAVRADVPSIDSHLIYSDPSVHRRRRPNGYLKRRYLSKERSPFVVMLPVKGEPLFLSSPC